jgi:hypothetical protein
LKIAEVVQNLAGTIFVVKEPADEDAGLKQQRAIGDALAAKVH